VVVISDSGGSPTGEPHLLDLGQPSVASTGKEIVGVEDSANFALDIDGYLTMAPALVEARFPGLDSLG